MRPSKATGLGTVGVRGARRGDLDLATQSAAQARPQSPETQSPGGGAQSAVTPLAIALDYIGRGWNPVPVPFRMKKPVDDDWQRRIITEVTAAAHFNSGPQNIGVMLGPTSHGPSLDGGQSDRRIGST